MRPRAWPSLWPSRRCRSFSGCAGSTGLRLTTLHRQHLGCQNRDAAREVSLERAAMPDASSAALAAHLLGRDTSAERSRRAP